MQPIESTIHEAVLRWIAAEGTGESASTDVGLAVGRLLSRLQDHLGRVLGGGGVRAIMVRCIRRQRQDHHELQALALNDPDLQTRLVEVLSSMPCESAQKAAEALLCSFVEILVSLIGATLAWRLLNDIWPPGAPPPADRFSEEVP